MIGAIEIVASLGDSVVGVAHREQRRGKVSAVTRAAVAIGLACAVAAIIAFAGALATAAADASRLRAWTLAHRPAFAFRPQAIGLGAELVVFLGGGLAIGALAFAYARALRERGRGDYRIGTARDVDQPVLGAPAASVVLVEPADGGFTFRYGAGIVGELELDGDVTSLVSDAPRTIAIAPRARIRTRVGGVAFAITTVDAPRAFAAPGVLVERRALAYLAASFAAHLVVWGIAWQAPIDGDGDDGDDGDGDSRWPMSTAAIGEPADAVHAAGAADLARADRTAERADDGARDAEPPALIAMSLPTRRSTRPASRAGATTSMALDDTRSTAADPPVEWASLEQSPTISDAFGDVDFARGFDDTAIYGTLADETGTAFGAFAVGRADLTRDATQWGTIDSDFISWACGCDEAELSGHGVAHGSSTGMWSRHAAGIPSLELAPPTEVGDVNAPIIRRYIRLHLAQLTYCYERRLLAVPTLQGEVVAQFFISPDGTVATSTAHGLDDEVASCVAGVIKSIEFPRPLHPGAGLQIIYPFWFRTP